MNILTSGRIPWTSFDPEGLAPGDNTNTWQPPAVRWLQGWAQYFASGVDTADEIVQNGPTQKYNYGEGADGVSRATQSLQAVQPTVTNITASLAVPEIIVTGTEVAAPIIVPRAGAIIEKTLGGTSEATESTISTSAPVVPPGIKTQETTTTESTQETAQIQQKPQQQDEQQQQQGRYVFDDPQYTVIGKREDLLSGKYEDGIYDHWYKSGRVPDVDLGEPPVTWAENQAWLDERIQRGDKFILGTDPTTLPPT